MILFTLLAGSKLLSSLKVLPLNTRVDTPWDEPSVKSPEFVRYANGEIFGDEPWRRIGPEAMCAFIDISMSIVKRIYADVMSLSALIRGILTINPYQRMSLADVAAHPWCMRSVFSLVTIERIF